MIDQERVAQALENCNRAEIARKLRVTRQAVHHWKEMGLVPPIRVLELSPLIGLKPHEIRPDIYPEPNGDAAE